MGQSQPLILYFRLFLIAIDRFEIIHCPWWDSNHGSLVSEATALPTAPGPRPLLLWWTSSRLLKADTIVGHHHHLGASSDPGFCWILNCKIFYKRGKMTNRWSGKSAAFYCCVCVWWSLIHKPGSEVEIMTRIPKALIEHCSSFWCALKISLVYCIGNFILTPAATNGNLRYRPLKALGLVQKIGFL